MNIGKRKYNTCTSLKEQSHPETLFYRKMVPRDLLEKKKQNIIRIQLVFILLKSCLSTFKTSSASIGLTLSCRSLPILRKWLWSTHFMLVEGTAKGVICVRSGGNH